MIAMCLSLKIKFSGVNILIHERDVLNLSSSIFQLKHEYVTDFSLSKQRLE